MSGIRWPLRLTAALIAGAALASGVAGCAETTRDAAGTSQTEPQQPDAAKGGAPPLAGVPEQPGPADQKPGLPDQKPGLPDQKPGQALPAPDSRSIIFTGTVTVRVRDVKNAAVDVGALATAAGGFVGADDRTLDDDRSTARLTLRVPSARFNSVVDAVARLAEKEESRQLSTQDVTEQVVDLDARINTTQASVDRVRALLARAQTISEIVSLESELSRREADLESLRSRKRKLDDLTSLSTITAVLLGPRAARDTAPEAESGFLAGLKAGWRAFVSSMQVLLTVIGALLPWLVALGVPLLLALWLARRLRSRRRDGAPTADPAGLPAD